MAVTFALRLSTVGSDVLDGIGVGVSEDRGVSVEVAVGVMKTVCVRVGGGAVNGSVTAASGVAVDVLIPLDVGEMGVDVRVQASEVTMNKIGKNGLRLI